MTNEQKQKLAMTLGVMGEYYSRQFSAPALRMMIDDLSDLSFDAVETSINQWRRDPKCKGFPMPSDIRARILPNTESPEDVGRIIAAKILERTRLDGYTNADRAKERIGELGWLVVQRMGGWQKLCEDIGPHNENTFHSRLRDLAVSLYKSAERGHLNLVHQVPNQAVFDKIFTDIFKELPKPEDE